MTKYAKRTARRLILKNKLFSNITLEKAKEIIEAQEFELIEFSRTGNDVNIEKLITLLKIEDRIKNIIVSF